MREKDLNGKIAGKKKNLKTLRLLVVEDHADMRTGLGVLFKLLGCQARFAPDLASARLAASAERFDVLLSDINLPDGNGWDFLRELKGKGLCPNVAIAMSGYGSDKDLAESQQAGFGSHLIKPFPPQELTAILQSTADSLVKEEPRVASQPRKKKLAHLRPEGGAGTAYSYL